MIDQFAPIIPYVGAGGLRLGWSMEQVETVTGPLRDGVPIEKLWIRYTVSDQLWLYFSASTGFLDKIVALPGYGGRRFSLIDTNTAESELHWREPSLVHREDMGFYISPKGAMIHTYNGKVVFIAVFSSQWKAWVQDIKIPDKQKKNS